MTALPSHGGPWSCIVDEDHSVALVLGDGKLTVVVNEFGNHAECALTRDQAVEMLRALRALLKADAT